VEDNKSAERSRLKANSSLANPADVTVDLPAVLEKLSFRDKLENLNPLVFIALSIIIALLTTTVSFFAFPRPAREYTKAGTFIDETKPSKADQTPATDSLKPVTSDSTLTDYEQAILEIDTVFNELDESKALTPSQLSNQSLGLE
jgi:hypothetical protein